MNPQIPLHRWQKGRYLNAATHNTSQAFAERQRERMRQAQQDSANVRPIIIKRKGNQCLITEQEST